MRWITPGGHASGLALDILKQPHTLIAGATGSGKSVLINTIVHAALFSAPSQLQMILIDPKRVELNRYRRLPHVLQYASEPENILQALIDAVDIMEYRYKRMQRKGSQRWTRGEIYIIVDEFADLMTTQKRETLPLLIRLAQLGRAAGLHLILATQRPTRDIVNGTIKVNIDARIALRCPTPQDSRNIIDQKGAELLPRYGHGYYLTPDTMQPVLVPIHMTSDEDIAAQIKHWTRQRSPIRRLYHRIKR